MARVLALERIELEAAVGQFERLVAEYQRVDECFEDRFVFGVGDPQRERVLGVGPHELVVRPLTIAEGATQPAVVEAADVRVVDASTRGFVRRLQEGQQRAVDRVAVREGDCKPLFGTKRELDLSESGIRFLLSFHTAVILTDQPVSIKPATY